MFCEARANPILRIITKPHQYQCHHEFRPKGADNNSQRIVCTTAYGNDDKMVKCKFCEIGKPTTRWLLGVIDRASNKYKLLDMNSAVFGQIKELRLSPHWGDPETYDIQLMVVDHVYEKIMARHDYKYQVIPIPTPNRALSYSDFLIKDRLDLDDLKRRCDPTLANSNDLFDSKEYAKVFSDW